MRPGPGLVVMALAFISGARRGSTSTSTSQHKLSSLTSSSSSSLSSSSSSSTSNLLLFPTNEYHYYQRQQQEQRQQQQLSPEQRAHSDQYPPHLSSHSSSASSSASSSPSSSSSISSSIKLSSAYSLYHSLGSSDSSSNSITSKYPSSLSSNYRNPFTVYNYDRNTDDIGQNYHFDNFKLDKITYVNVEDYGENIEEVGVVSRGSGDSSGAGDRIEEDDQRGGYFFAGVQSHSHIFESSSSLSRVNPWLSACDLAQPSSAPDLQGQCTAGSLPVAWVDEGPGPPTCPKSCEQLRLENSLNSNTNSNSKKLLYNSDNNYLINSNFNSVQNIMSKVRREIAGHQVTSVAAKKSTTAKTTTTASSSGSATKSDSSPVYSQKTTTIKPPTFVERTTSTVSTASINANKMVADKTVEYQLGQQHQGMQNDAQSSIQDHQHNYNNFNNYNNIVKNNLNLNNNKNSGNTKNNNINNFNSNNIDSNKLPNDNRNQYNQNQQQQQCLDYLGDNDDSSPTQLCKNSQSDLANKLRTLRLKHCCERTVFSALHTIALNATLGGGPQCVQVLTDILDLDTLATRITCELAEILFRYDCRQIYSLMHQCKDCKEAYRRWVCSTLIPYFTEQDSTNNVNGNDLVQTTSNIAITSNSKIDYNSTPQSDSSEQFSLNTNDGHDKRTEKSKIHPDSLSVYDEDDSAELEQIPSLASLASSSAYSNIAKNMQPQQPYQDEEEHQQEGQRKAVNVVKRSKNTDCQRKRSNIKSLSKDEEQTGGSPRRNKDFISTANNNSDPCEDDPVISRLLKRSKRKVEFRKRRRIRPCLSVCQTVEQKCPYLLPGDRAPAYPTQYAGEPTFLCLDQNIPETGEQLLKSNHGPPDCCYRYCSQPEFGICVFCDDFYYVPGTATLNTTVTNDHLPNNSVPIKDSRQPTLPSVSSHDDLNTSAETLNTTGSRRSNATVIASIEDIPKLSYYAYADNVYYYDDIIDLPSDPVPECQPVASTTSRCTMPYFASSATPIYILDKMSFVRQHYVLILASIFWYLVNNYILVAVHNVNGSNYHFFYYCCYNFNDWWRRLITLIMTVISL